MFLSINGIQVPVASGSISETRPDRPGIVRGYGGGLNSLSLRRRRTWRVTTARMAADDATRLEALLCGLGDSIPYDTSIFGERLRPAYGTVPIASLRPAVAADGRAVADTGKFGGAVAVEPATTNILAAAQRDAEGAVGGNFVAVDAATLATTTVNRYEQLQSLQVTTSAVVNGLRGGFQTSPVAAPGASTYVSSCYALCAAGTASLRCFTRNLTLATISATVVHNLNPGIWQRIWSAALPGVLAGNSLCMEVVEDTPDVGLTFFVDALQIEAATFSFTSWADPTRAAGSLSYDASDLFRNLERGFALSAWVQSLTPPGTAVLLTVPGTLFGSGSYSYLRLTHTGTSLTLAATDRLGASRSATTGSVASGLYHFAIVYRHTPLAAEPRLELYVNGLLAASIPSSGAGALGPFDLFAHMKRLEVLFDSSGPFYGNNLLVDDLCLTPWPMTASEVAAVAASTERLRRGPALQVTGTFLRGETLECFATLGPSTYETFHRGAAGWDSSARSVSFDLEER